MYISIYIHTLLNVCQYVCHLESNKNVFNRESYKNDNTTTLVACIAVFKGTIMDLYSSLGRVVGTC